MTRNLSRGLRTAYVWCPRNRALRAARFRVQISNELSHKAAPWLRCPCLLLGPQNQGIFLLETLREVEWYSQNNGTSRVFENV